MKFGMFTSGYQRLPLEKCFTDAAQLGYDYIELWGGYPHAFAPDVIEDYREIRRLQEHYGIPVPVYTPEHNAYPYNYMLGTEKQWRNCMAYLEVSVRAAGLIGAGQMLISVGHGGECPAAPLCGASCLRCRTGACCPSAGNAVPSGEQHLHTAS